MGRGVLSLLALVALCAPGPAAAQTPVILKPSSQWAVDYAPERCTLVRQFDGKSTMWLRIDSYGIPQRYRMMIWGDDIPRKPGPFGDIAFRLTPDEDLREERAGQGLVGEIEARFISIDFGPAHPEEEEEERDDPEAFQAQDLAAKRARLPAIKAFRKRIENIEIHFDRRRIFDLRTGAMENPLEALDLCAEDLLQSWGLDLAQQQSLTRNPIPDPGAIKRMIENFPVRMARKGTNAHVPVRIMVAADGSAESCVIQIEGIDKEFRNNVCDNLSGTYQPALDANGDPVRSVFLTAVVYTS